MCWRNWNPLNRHFEGHGGRIAKKAQGRERGPLRDIRIAQAALLRQGLRRDDIQRMTMPELHTYLEIFYPRKGGAKNTVYKSLRRRSRNRART